MKGFTMLRAFIYGFAFVAFIATVLSVPVEAGWRKEQRRASCSGDRVKVRRTRGTVTYYYQHPVVVRSVGACNCPPGCPSCQANNCHPGQANCPCHKGSVNNQDDVLVPESPVQ